MKKSNKSWIRQLSESYVRRALNEQSEYMDAQGRIAPCCWLGGTQDKFTDSFDDIQLSWSSATPNAVCKKTCTTSNNQSSFSSQWQREVNLAI